MPGGLAFGKADLLGEPGLGRDARADDAVVEPEHPDPAAVEHVVQGGVVGRVGEGPRSERIDAHLVDAVDP